MPGTGIGTFDGWLGAGDSVVMRQGIALNSTVIGGAACVAGVALVVAAVLWMSRPPRSTAVQLQLASSAEPGKAKFLQSCSNCHGPEGRGLPRTGPDLTTSKFVAAKTDAELVDFVKAGRLPGQPGSVMNLPMPPRGGNMTLTDADLTSIAKHIRTLQVVASPNDIVQDRPLATSADH